MTAVLTPNAVRSPARIVLDYHARTKHSLKRYAAGPETLDWDAQPNPFREFDGAPRTPLLLNSGLITTRFGQIYDPSTIAPAPLTLASVSTLLELSMGLSAWKEYGPDRWPLRCNPSSGNLHPTETYAISSRVPGLDDGLYHYAARAHALERRSKGTKSADSVPCLLIGLSSIHWREAWKYGERAFRYCQLDLGHALGAIRYAAGALGWNAKIVGNLGSAALSATMGLDRIADFSNAEQEDADVILLIDTNPAVQTKAGGIATPADESWAGKANRLDRHPLYRWPVIDEVSLASRGHGGGDAETPLAYPPLGQGPDVSAAQIFLGRRSAQHFDTKYTMPADIFYRLLDSLLTRPIAPWDIWDFAPRLHPFLFVHRVEGLEPGLYALPRNPIAKQELRELCLAEFQWQMPESAPAHLPFFKLLRADCRAVARTISCHQAIASDSCFAMSMLAEFEPLVTANPWRYRQLHWEAGLLGQVLYLEAEAAGLRGTGIGCYLDDPLHELLGLKDQQYQALYHFTVGRPLTDSRITTLPAYPGRQPERCEA